MIGWVLLVSLWAMVPISASAADVVLGWQGHANATHYRIYQSLDNGKTWKRTGPDVPQPKPFPANKQVRATVTNVSEDGLVLFRASAIRAGDEAMAYHMGAWYDHRLSPPSVSGLGVR